MHTSRFIQRDRIAGGLVGLLIGDAVGVPYEFKRPEQIRALDIIDMTPPLGFDRTYPATPPGTWSDDGAQALCLLESLLECDGLDLEDFAGRLLRWRYEGHLAVDAIVFDVGIQTGQALSALRRGVPPESAGPSDERNNGNGSLMRVLPLALWHRGSDEDLIQLAMRQSLPTHGHQRSQLCCALYCLWARRLLSGEGGWDEALAQANASIGTNADWHAEWARLVVTLESPPRGSGYVVDCLVSARHALDVGDNYADVVRAAISLGYDTDTTAAVAGGLAGIRHGLYGIYPRWRGQLRGQELLQPLLDRLLTTVSPYQVEAGGTVRTSDTHPLQIGTLELGQGKGRIGVTFCPGKQQAAAVTGRWARDLDSDLEAIRQWGATHLVTLIEPQEISALGVQALPDRAAHHGLSWHHLPITDGSVPDRRFERAWESLGPLLRQEIAAGVSVMVHCKGGLGRAGTIAAQLLIELGEVGSGEEAIQRVRGARPNAIETLCQEEYLVRLAKRQRVAVRDAGESA